MFERTRSRPEGLPLRERVPVLPAASATGREAVVLVEDTDRRMVLEHVLLLGDPVVAVRQGRQTWTPDPSAALDFHGEQRWTLNAWPATRDEPVGPAPAPHDGRTWRLRLAGPDEQPLSDVIGRWDHDAGTGSSFRQLGFSTRPLEADPNGSEATGAGPGADADADGRSPRLLLASTTLSTSPTTAGGWSRNDQGQVRVDGSPVHRFQELRQYRRVGSIGEADRLHRNVQAEFWGLVRDLWQQRLTPTPDRPLPLRYRLRGERNGLLLHEALFEAAAADPPADPAPLLDRYVEFLR